jgi:hypothetical protein
MDLEQLYWFFKLGKPKNRASIFDLRNNPGHHIQQPVFFLSTGRCGTKWFSSLLSSDPGLALFHQPTPSMAMQSRTVYEILVKRGGAASEEEKSLIIELFWAARENHLRYTYKTGKRYVETNNYITFFAPFLYEIFPEARFVHLVRHPGEFVRSGVNRNYYTDTHSDDTKRIEPVTGKIAEKWSTMGQVEKTAWLWNETNLFIRDFLTTIPGEQQTRFNFNQLEAPLIQDVLQFMGSDIALRKINKLIPKRINAQASTTVKTFENWDDKEKQIVAGITGELAREWGYSI